VWEQIRSNRRRSAFVVAAMGVVLVASGAALGGLVDPSPGAALLGALVALGVWLVLWLISLSQGDAILLRMAGAREIRKRDHPRLVNVVEEMAIAAQLGRVPRVFVVDDPAPNAFATGRDPENAAVAVTTGLLAILSRDELQGVVAHELGHVKNRDVALLTTTGIMLGSIVLLAELGIRMLWFGGGRRSRSDSGGGHAVIAIVAIVMVILAPILAQLIYFALSRRREYLADASGALFTRYPEGLASALVKLGGARIPQADQSRVTAPMYIVAPLRAGSRGAGGSWFATHPPIDERVRILRGMGGDAGLRAYEAAFRQVKHGGIVGARTLAAAAAAPARDRSAADEHAPHERARAASDAFLSASGYARRPCAGCGAVLKVPPSLATRVRACPRCGADL
jgi:heat shock protein HtpX